MENNTVNDFYSQKSVCELIDQLKSQRITGTTMSQAWFEGLVAHLAEREMSDEEREIVDDLLSSEPQKVSDEEKKQILLTNRKFGNQPIPLGPKKYPALRTISGIYTAFAIIFGIAAVIAGTIFLTKEESELFIGLTILAGGVIIVLALLAAAEVIKVIVDIEENTRRTALKK